MSIRLEDLVIVSYDESVDLFLLQLKTLNVFLEKCTIHLVINEDEIKYFYRKVKPALAKSKHDFIVYGRKSIIGHIDGLLGWHSQQLIKLSMPIEGRYLILDDKDLLVKPLTLKDLDAAHTMTYTPVMVGDPPFDVFLPFFKKCKRLIKTRNRPMKYSPKIIDMPINWTPAVIEQDVVEDILQCFAGKHYRSSDDIKRNFANWMFSGLADPKGGQPAEFMLYDLFRAQLKGPRKKFPGNFIAWAWDYKEFLKLSNTGIKENTHIVKIHHNVYRDKNCKPSVDAMIDAIIDEHNYASC